MKKKIIVFTVTMLILFLNTFSFAEETVSFKVIVHASNSVSQLTKSEISKLFLKKVKRWEDIDETVSPVDLTADSPVRHKFSKDIHNRKIASIKAYWQKQIFSGRGVPPEEKTSDEDVLEYVSKNAGGIGYISETTEIAEYDVKTIDIVDK